MIGVKKAILPRKHEKAETRKKNLKFGAFYISCFRG
jgi:hypothetical protein